MEDFIGVYNGNIETAATKAIDRNKIVLYGFQLYGFHLGWPV